MGQRYLHFHQSQALQKSVSGQSNFALIPFAGASTADVSLLNGVADDLNTGKQEPPYALLPHWRNLNRTIILLRNP